jgi:hypothetical protein
VIRRDSRTLILPGSLLFGLLFIRLFNVDLGIWVWCKLVSLCIRLSEKEQTIIAVFVSIRMPVVSDQSRINFESRSEDINQVFSNVEDVGFIGKEVEEGP